MQTNAQWTTSTANAASPIEGAPLTPVLEIEPNTLPHSSWRRPDAKRKSADAGRAHPRWGMSRAVPAVASTGDESLLTRSYLKALRAAEMAAWEDPTMALASRRTRAA